MDLQTGLYIEINLICIFLLVEIFIKVFFDIRKQREYKIFSLLVLFSIIHCIVDGSWKFVDKQQFPNALALNTVLNVLYFMITGIGGYLWLLYAECFINPEKSCTKKYILIASIPCDLLCILSIISPSTHILFYIDETNTYLRGWAYPVEVILANCYFLITTVQALRLAFKKENYIFRKKYLNLASFIFWPVIFDFFQAFLPGYPYTCVGLTFALLGIFINMRDFLISVDTLTQLNNRNQMLKYLELKLKQEASKENDKEKQNGKELYLMIMDVNNFKKINDTYGHIEGDNALIRVANSLKLVSSKENVFICRYGGDEFIVIGEKSSEKEIDLLCSKINSTITLENIREGKDYTLGVSIGWAKYDKTRCTANDLINAADKILYEEKARNKIKR